MIDNFWDSLEQPCRWAMALGRAYLFPQEGQRDKHSLMIPEKLDGIGAPEAPENNNYDKKSKMTLTSREIGGVYFVRRSMRGWMELILSKSLKVFDAIPYGQGW